MRLITSWLVVAGVIAGVGGAILGYHAVSTGTNERPVAAPVAVPAATPAPQVRIRLLPCESGWVRHGKACVRVRTKVVVVAAAARPVYLAAVPVQVKSSPRAPHRTHTRPPSSGSTTHPVTGPPGVGGSDQGSGAGGVPKDD